MLSSLRSSFSSFPLPFHAALLGGFFIVSLLLGACSDDASSPGDAPGEGILRVDAGADLRDDVGDDVIHDTGTSEGIAGEGRVDDARGADQGIRGCASGLNLAPLSLASAYCVGARVAAPAVAAFAFSSSALVSFEAAPTARRFVLRRRSLGSQGVSLAAASDLFSFSVAGSQDLFAGHYLAVAPTGSTFAVGYTLKDQSGAILYGAAGSTPTELAAAGNYDALYLDAATLLVNGQGLGATGKGHAVYVYRGGKGAKLITEIGSFSGFIAKGEHLLFAGGFTKKNELWAFSLAEVKAAIASGKTLSGPVDGDLVYAGPITDAVALGDDLVFIDDDFVSFHAVRRLAMTVTGDSVSAGATSDLVTPGSTSKPVKVKGLSVAGPWLGLHFTASQGDELALVREK